MNFQSTVRIIDNSDFKNQLFITSHQLQNILYQWIFAIMQVDTFFSTLKKKLLELQKKKKGQRVCVQTRGQAQYSKSEEAEVGATAGAWTERTVDNSPRIQAVAGLQGPWSSWSKATLCVQEHSLQGARGKYINSPFLSWSSCSWLEGCLGFSEVLMVQGIHLNTADDTCDQFLLGCVFIPWHIETIEPECFNDINESKNEENVALDLENRPPHSQTPQKTGLP